jgi:uncharacterized protein with HEPN domain
MFSEADRARIEACIEHIDFINDYTKNILTPEDFLKPEFHVVFDASLMRLQALGETLQALDKKHPSFGTRLNYSQLSNVIRFRDFISHHYDKVGHVDILHLIRVHLPELRSQLETLLHNLND